MVLRQKVTFHRIVYQVWYYQLQDCKSVVCEVLCCMEVSSGAKFSKDPKMIFV